MMPQKRYLSLLLFVCAFSIKAEEQNQTVNEQIQKRDPARIFELFVRLQENDIQQKHALDCQGSLPCLDVALKALHVAQTANILFEKETSGNPDNQEQIKKIAAIKAAFEEEIARKNQEIINTLVLLHEETEEPISQYIQEEYDRLEKLLAAQQ